MFWEYPPNNACFIAYQRENFLSKCINNPILFFDLLPFEKIEIYSYDGSGVERSPL